MVVSLIAGHTPKCRDMTRLISESQDRQLPWRTRLAMWLHHRICVWCERYQNQLEFIGRAMHAFPEHGTEQLRFNLSPATRERMKAHCKAHGQRTGSENPQVGK